MSLEIVLQSRFYVFTKVLPSISVTRLSVPNNAHFIEENGIVRKRSLGTSDACV